VELMIECLRAIPTALPTVGVDAIQTARRFWIEHSVPASNLEKARVACWTYLDERSASTNTDVPEYCAVRAVICVLYADPPSKDLGDLIEFFGEMLAGALNSGTHDSVFADLVPAVEDFLANRGRLDSR